jgi:phosphatidylethanolamine-binding protein (PEBP) family uncharacterized protein
MKKRFGLALFSVLAIGSAQWACSGGGGGHPSDTGGAGGEDTGGSTGTTGGSTGSTGGKTGTGGSTSTGGASGGNTGGAGDTGGAGGSNTGGAGDTGGAGGSTGGAGGSTGGAGGSTGGMGGGGGGGMGGDAGGPLKFNALGLNPTGTKMYMAPSFPKAMSNGGGNHSPAMEWTGDAPAGTKSWAITLIDTNKTVQPGQTVTPNTFVKVHFSYYDIPLATRSLKADLPRSMTIPDPAGMKASATFSGAGWFGPGAGGDPHIYILSLWALNVDKLAGGGPQQGTYDAIVKAAIGQPIKLVIVGTNNGI